MAELQSELGKQAALRGLKVLLPPYKSAVQVLGDRCAGGDWSSAEVMGVSAACSRMAWTILVLLDALERENLNAMTEKIASMQQALDSASDVNVKNAKDALAQLIAKRRDETLDEKGRDAMQ